MRCSKVAAVGVLALLFLVAGADVSPASSPYVAKEYILLSCGFAGVQTDEFNRNWTGDSDSQYAPSLNATGSQVWQHESSVRRVPYLTARVFTTSYTYYIPLSAGRKYVRLYFYPANYSSGHVASDALFSVTSGATTFLSNFNASATAQASNLQYLVKEFSINVTMGGLNLSFTPSTSYANAYAFINGIEIISIPDLFGLKVFWLPNGRYSPLKLVDPDWAFETVHRLNIGGKSVSPIEDSGLYRSWNADDLFVSDGSYSYNADGNVTITYTDANPSYMAPEFVYSSARSMGRDDKMNLRTNVTWLLPVDAGFEYFVRLHFCEIKHAITKPNQRVFDIYINNQTAEEGFDVIFWSGGTGIPIYMDYVVSTIGSGKMDLPIVLHPDQISSPQYDNVVLNGLEVFKLQNSNGSLAAISPIIQSLPPIDAKKSKKNFIIVSGVIGGFIVLLLSCSFFVWVYKHP